MDDADDLLPQRRQVAHVPWLFIGIGVGIGAAAGSFLIGIYGPFPDPEPLALFVVGVSLAMGASAWLSTVERRRGDAPR